MKNPYRTRSTTRSPPRPARPAVAKIDPPRLYNIYRRKRLFQLLDRCSDRRLIWLSAPPGYGKTVAVASWLQSRPGAVIWYQCDEGDADIASFFHFLSAAVADLSSVQDNPLPLLSPELYPALPTFVRNYFREFCGRLTAPTVVVLDNWQDIPPGAALRELLPVAIGELPRGIVVVVISREEPAANLSRLQLTEQMATLGWADLQLTEQETGEIAASYATSLPARSAISARELHTLTQGWAAGVTALLRLEGRRPLEQFDVHQVAVQTVFNYMTAEVLDRLSGPVTDFLLKTSCLEYITVPVASQLSANPEAGEILESLVRTNAFTLKRSASAAYYYHPLFRELLRSRAAARFSIAERRELLATAARILADNQDAETAIELLLEAGRWEDASALVLRLAPTLMEEGRFQTLSTWIDALPQPLQRNSSWLSYWRGMVQMAIAFRDAAATFERAYELFVAEDDQLGQMLSIAAILQHHHVSFTDFRPMVPWIEALVRRLGSEPRFPSASVELSVLTGLFTAIILAEPRNPLLTRCRDRIARLMGSDADLRSKASGAAALINYFAITGDVVHWRAALPDADWGQGRSELSPALRIQNLWLQAFQFQLTGEDERCQAMLDSALQISEQHGLPLFASRVLLSKLQATDFAARTLELSDGLARLQSQFATASPLMMCHLKYVSAMFHLARGDLPSATRDIAAADLIASETGYALVRSLIFIGMAEIMCEMGRLDDALSCLARIPEIMGDFRSPLLDFNGGLVKAEIARRKGSRVQFIETLGATLAVGRAQGFANGFHSYPVLLPRLVAHALEHDIEVDYCRWLIRRRNFRPPRCEIRNWPWPIRIYSLGRFQLYVDDRPLEVRGKSQRRPLSLLKAMLASRSGLEIDLLMDRLWPDLEGDAARNAFDLAVHRLRKLLRHKNAVVVSQGRLMLNQSMMRVDAFALEALAESGDVEDPAPERARRLLDLYRGPFLADQAEPWMFAARERLRSTFLRCVGQLGDVMQASHDYDALINLYQRVLEIEPVAEQVYRSLMRCLIAQGRHAEALRVYHQYNEVLSTLLQAQPSAPMQQLYASLLKQ